MHTKRCGAEQLDFSLDKRLRAYGNLREKQDEANRFLQVTQWKGELGEGFPVIAGIMGGTGTGKSTVFNSLAGRAISEVGVRRPCTTRPVLFVHGDFVEELRRCPLLAPDGDGNDDALCTTVTIQSHGLADLAGLVLVDTPDFDSVDTHNRLIADNFFIISDIIVFVTSQEKYGDMRCHEVRDRAVRWGKNMILIMNKVGSDAAFDDFCKTFVQGGQCSPIRIERYNSSPELIPDLPDSPGLAGLFEVGAGGPSVVNTRKQELERLKAHTLASLEDLEASLRKELERIRSLNRKIQQIADDLSGEMEDAMRGVLPATTKEQIEERLQALLTKYDIFFTPRAIVRSAVKKILGAIGDLIFSAGSVVGIGDKERESRKIDLLGARSRARLKPLESAVARMDLRIAGLISSDPELEDLRDVAARDVPQWAESEIQGLFDAAFPRVEALLEADFARLREGLSRSDEIKLYGSYTLWALLIITAETVMGGGFPLLDAALNTVVFPFIPKWLLSVKVVEVLREIGQKVDQEYHAILRGILHKRADLYMTEFRGLAPDEQALDRLAILREELLQPPAKGSFGDCRA